MRRQRSGQAGFTLVEMLVGIALFSLILSSFAAMFYRLQTTNAAISRVERSENIDVVRRHLKQSLEGMRAHSRLDSNGMRTVRFEGEPSRVAFVTIAPGDRETGGLYETEIWLDSEGRLLQQRRPLGWGQEMKGPPEVLIEEMASIIFSYFPCPLEVHNAAVNRWVNTSQLPFLISVTAAFKSGERQEWREISAFIPAAACPVDM